MNTRVRFQSSLSNKGSKGHRGSKMVSGMASWKRWCSRSTKLRSYNKYANAKVGEVYSGDRKKKDQS